MNCEMEKRYVKGDYVCTVYTCILFSPAYKLYSNQTQSIDDVGYFAFQKNETAFAHTQTE